MTHLWVRAEQRPNEDRVGLTPDGAKAMIEKGIRVTVERSDVRAIGLDGYVDAGCEIAPQNSWPTAPADAIIFGLKELPDDDTPLPHRHIMFGHAFKGQPDGPKLLARFKAGGGSLFDLEYLVDPDGRRVAAFGYWAGYAGAAVSLKCWISQQKGEIAGAVGVYPSAAALRDELHEQLDQIEAPKPTAIIIGAKGRVGSGAADLCAAMGLSVTGWDMAETAHGGPFPEVLQHDIFLNCILAQPGVPVFVPADAGTRDRKLTVIGDIACDPGSSYNPVPVYDRTTTWDEPALRVADAPPLDVTAIDNLPSMLPVESSMDYAGQLLPSLLTLDAIDTGVWARAKTIFDTKTKELLP